MSSPGTSPNTSRALDPGLARERTSLSWTRTALALLGNGLLVMIRHQRAFPLPVSVVLAGLSLVVALLVLVHAARRSMIVRLPDRAIGPATWFVVPLGVAVMVLCAGTAVAILRWP